MKYLLAILSIVLIFSCSKKEVLPTKDGDPIDHWEKFIGNYNVYDTLGVYLYDMKIDYYSGHTYSNGYTDDSLIIRNFADTFDILFRYQLHFPSNYFTYVWTDSIVDYSGKTWGMWTMPDDTLTPKLENALINDTIIFYYDIDNIKWYIQEAQPYYQCHCKVVAVKQ